MKKTLSARLGWMRLGAAARYYAQIALGTYMQPISTRKKGQSFYLGGEREGGGGVIYLWSL